MGERPGYLAGACRGNSQLRRRLEALRAAQEAPEGFLPDDPARPQPVRQSSQPAWPPPSEQPGDRHRPLQAAGEDRRRRLRRGLHGRAERAGRRQVALKVIKLGMDTQAGRRPLRGRAPGPGPDGPSEHRQGPRRRRHGDGRPYFVMELVRRMQDHRLLRPEPPHHAPTARPLHPGLPAPSSTPIRRASSIATSSLRTSWCTLHDGVPVPKVIDFGIAKATTGTVDRPDRSSPRSNSSSARPLT